MRADPDIFDVAIIGGGFSGLLALHHLVRTGGSDNLFAIIEPDKHLGHGMAYSTTNARHLLNVPAGKMSALPDHPNHFITWLLDEKGCKASSAIGIDRVWHADDYVPRCLYARYLDDIAQETFQEARAKGIHLQHLRQKAVDIERTSSSGFYALKLDDGRLIQSRAVILATGNLSAQDTENPPGFISDPWSFDYLSSRDETGPVGVIGTGLTMVDTMLSLREAGFAGKIVAASRRGLLPEVHDDTHAVYTAAISLPVDAPGTLASLLRALRDEARICLSQQITWQRVFDRWRPHAAAIWQKLDTNDRRRFFKKFFTLWNIHRHRMAPQIRAFVDKELASGGLKILKGAVRVVPKRDGLSLTVGAERYDIKKVFDCRGSCNDISLSNNDFITNLHRKGLIQRHETGWGMKISGDLQVLPLGQDGSFLAIGPALIGEYLETTAVPELRQQAQKAAVSLGAFIRPSKDSGSKYG